MATMPTAVADWIVRYLGNDLPDWKAQCLKVYSTERGLNELTVKQLKTIWHAVEPHTAVRRPPSYAKKAVWVDQVRRAFSEDVTTVLDHLPTTPYYAVARASPVSSLHPSHAPARQAIAHGPQAVVRSPQAVPPHLRHGPSHSPARQAIAHRPQAAARSLQAVPPHQRHGPSHSPARQAIAHRPQAAARSLQAVPPHLRHGPSHSPARQAIAHRPQAAARSLQAVPPHPRHGSASPQKAAAHRQQAAPHLPCASYAGSPPMHYKVPAPSPARPATPTRANKKVKRESNDSSMWEAHPRTAQEHMMVAQLRQMGFTDMREMLAGIRHVSSTDMSSQVEDAMMWIVSQREEVEEARKIDAARARSEMLRAEQAKLRKKAAHERLWGTSLDDWLSNTDLFRGSIVLSEARARLEPLITENDENKQELIKFLELEKKARKWYGTSVPWRYLYDMSERWKQLSSDELLVKNIENESNALETAMYSLSEQQGGVPKLFLEARFAAEKNGLPVSPQKEGAFATVGDDDVIVVKEVPGFQALSGVNTSASNGTKGEVEVIEIF